ncbi:DEAD/DEAH box helicase [Bacillus songklensis]|uniref:DEAD/DEAH box helicase n=1 Tax=Bacillus songklensis TaxID=1069116 RepID=A0ABV8B110_9BACI
MSQFLTNMKPFLQEAWKKAGFESATAIQEKAIPLILEGKDVMAESPTGTGKTITYLLPLLEKINPDKQNTQAIIVAPSRELVMQILQVIQEWSEGSGITNTSLIGGANVKRQLEKLKKAPHVVVGTPGRIDELIKMKKLKMHEVKIVALDEGDQLLVPEHLQTVKNIVKATMADRQIVLFSATLPETTETIARELMNQPEIVKMTKEDMPPSKVEHLYIVCDQREKLDMLRKLLHVDSFKALAFIRDIGNLTVTKEKLQYKGIAPGVLHGESKKEERAAALKNFRTGKSPLLLATDVAARGLDIKGLTHVIHVDFPKDIKQYVHRSGRTGRQGATGTVISLVTEREERVLKQYARELGITVQQKVLYGGQLVDERKKEEFRPKKRPVHQNRNVKKRF